MNTWEKELPVDSRPLPKEPPSAVTLCWTSSCRFVQVTRVPTWTVTVAGLKAKSAIRTAREPAVGVGVGGAVVGLGVAGARVGEGRGVGEGLASAWAVGLMWRWAGRWATVWE